MNELLHATGAWLADPARWNWWVESGIPFRTRQHLSVSLVATALACAVAVPVALHLAHRRRAEALASSVVNIGRAIPSFGLIVLFWLLATRTGWVGTQFWPLVLALVALAMPPIFTNTYTAVRDVDAATVEAARGMGYTESQVLRRIELPRPAPIMLAGIRIAFVQVVATTAIGAIVTNGGGLGRYVVDGFARGVPGRPTVLGGALLLVCTHTALPTCAFGLLERLLVPRRRSRTATRGDVAVRVGAAG